MNNITIRDAITIRIEIDRNILNHFISQSDEQLNDIMNISFNDPSNVTQLDPLPEDTISKIKKEELVVDNESGLIGSVCSICQSEYNEGDLYVQLCCGHNNHSNCLCNWLSYGNHCPLCREVLCVRGVSPLTPLPHLPPQSQIQIPPLGRGQSTTTQRPPQYPYSESNGDLYPPYQGGTNSDYQMNEPNVPITVNNRTRLSHPNPISNSSLGNILAQSPPHEPNNGIKIVIQLPNNIRYRRCFNNVDRVGDLLNYIRQIARESEIQIGQLNLHNRNGQRCDYNNSLAEAGIINGTNLTLVTYPSWT